MAHPFKAFLNVKKGEWTLAISMFLYFFLVITTFWVLKPIKKTVFITYYDDLGGFEVAGWEMTASQAELWAKVMNMVVAFAAVVVFTILARKLFRQQLSFAFTGFFIAAFALYAVVGLGHNSLVLDESGAIETVTVIRPSAFVVWSFYLFGDLYSTLMVATFFAFLNDSVRPNDAKRLYGLIVLGGVSGGVFGTMGVRVWLDSVTTSGWLWICLGLAIGIAVCASVAGRAAQRLLPRAEAEALAKATSDEAEEGAAKKGNAALEGAKLVFKSKYLLAIVAIVGLYEIASTVLDYQFSETIAFYLDGPAIGEQFSTVYLITNITSMVVQLFVTGFIMTRFGVGVALMIAPAMMLLGSLGFLAAPILWTGSLLNTVDNAFNYSINQSAKEALYTPTTRDEKYKAKAFIDMFVQRFAKAVAVGVSLVIGVLFTVETADGGTQVDFGGLRWLSVFTIVIMVIWIYAVRYAGKRFRELTPEDEGPSSSD